MAKSEAIYHGDPRHHHSDIVKLKARVKELEADVQRPTPPLTDEELAELMWKVAESSIVRRLIADLRSSRARVKELETDVVEYEELMEVARNHCGCLPL